MVTLGVGSHCDRLCFNIASRAQDNCTTMDGVIEILGLNLLNGFKSRYSLKAQLGQGAYGKVWTTSPILKPDEEYAVKIIDTTKLKKGATKAVFKEVQILRELEDLKHVIPIIDFVVEPSTLYIVLLHAKGGDLFGRLRKKNNFTEKDARDIAATLLETLDIMHTKYSIVHRDLKPENLLLEDDVSQVIYFADFGFAKHVPENGLKTRCGTPAFTAPEIILGSRYGQAVDMWSIGCILYTMIGGYHPFQDPESQKQYTRKNRLKALFGVIRAGDYTFHAAQWENVSIEAKRLITSLLTVNPHLRWSAKQALESTWIKELDDKTLSQRDLSKSVRALEKSSSKITLKGAMHAVKWAVSANFWNPDAATFSPEVLQLNDQIITEVMKAPAKTTFGNQYRLHDIIQKGSSATVWRCEHKGTHKIFAVKIIKRSGLEAFDDEFVMNEVSIMKSLSQLSKYVVQLADFYEEPDNFYLVMEHMGGGDVFDRVLEKAKYTEEDARRLTIVLLKAVRSMHSVGIAHRDLKPQNLLLTSEDDDAGIKIADFGFSRRVFTPQSLTSRCGTPTFVAPEILKNIPHDERADLWSVGVIIYVLLVGYPPFLADSLVDLLQRVRRGEWKFFKEDWKNISRDAQELICNLLVVDPQQRWTIDDAFSCKWIQQSDDTRSSFNLSGSLRSLRDRKEIHRELGRSVVWRNKATTPVNAATKI